MPKQEILDPQGQAVVRALGRIGVTGVSDVRQGKRFELEVADDVSAEDLERVAATLLANTVIEDYEIVTDGAAR
ncbi:phosphoribosylformylglycinamidine synthase [Corynebacterium bovis DSM 20582 = CIP 54.80]|nr:phosphoribosylformylglycinamidine synthase [Corynebacterium bovis DSM 20582 = CIP 54.80]